MDQPPKRNAFILLVNAIYTFIVFIGFLLLIPFLCLVYLYVKICRYLWLRRLSRRYPDLEVVRHLSVRSAMDTYRCQGIISVLLQIRGQCDENLVKQKIMEDVIEKQNRDGTLRFPHMKTSLTQCWGRYAWFRDSSEFDIENHVIHVTNPTLRNRIVTSENIREYVSDAITKYLPPWNKIPPWQVMLITTEPDKFYILARVHHLYISEDGISFSHLLMVDTEDQSVLQPISNPNDLDSIENILQSVFRKPRYIPMLYNRIRRYFTDIWDDLMKAYDPLQNPYFLKSSPNIFQFYMVCLVAYLATVVEYYQTDPRVKFSALLRDQMKRRQITARFFVKCFINTLYPLVIIKIMVAWTWWFSVKCVLHLPISMLHILYDSPSYMKWFFVLLRCCGEVLYLLHLMYTAPRILLDELILPMFHLPKHHLQKVSLSGRKLVHWTDPIPVEQIRRIRDKTGVASCEIQLYCVSAALNYYFQRNNLPYCDEILTTARFVPQEQLLRSANRISSGLLCLSLPMNLPEDDALYGLHMMQLSLQDALSMQTALYLASLSQYDYGILTTVFPSILARIVLYVLSTRYSVMMTQIEPHNKEMRRRRLIWGQEVESFIYWRPPQANVSVSMTLINYGDEIRFAVMADAELAPEFKDIVDQFVNYLNKLSEEAENYVPEYVEYEQDDAETSEL